VKIKELKEGYRIEYKFISEEQLKYAQTPVLNLEQAEAKMTELSEDLSVQDFILLDVKYFDKLN